MNYGKTRIVVCKDEKQLGVQAANTVGATMRDLLGTKNQISVIFAAGESQMTFLDALAVEPGIDWSRVVCFNMDDFWDPNIPDHYTCGYQTRVQLYEKVHPREFHVVESTAADPHQEAHRFEALLRSQASLDILCQGIGTSGHLALNEPFDADFHDAAWVKVVNICEQSKLQLRTDPNFEQLGYIPTKGISMTIPALLSASFTYTMVPLALKRPILSRLLQTKEPTPAIPASILSEVVGTLFVDKNSLPLPEVEAFAAQ